MSLQGVPQEDPPVYDAADHDRAAAIRKSTDNLIDLLKAAKYIEQNLAEMVWKKDLMDTHALYSDIDSDAVGNTIHILYHT